MDDVENYREPLAERMRPQTLDEMVGQGHLLGDAEILRRIVKQKEPVSLILWGPPGTGKTTLARIIASTPGAINLRTLNTVERISTEPSQKTTILFPVELLEAVKTIGDNLKK